MYTLMKELGTNWVPKIEYAVRAKKKDEEAGKDKKIEEGKENKEVGEDKKDEEKEKWYKFEKVTQHRAVINDSLFLRFMKKRITRTKFDHCHDFIVLKFNYNVKYRVGKNGQPRTVSANELRELFYKKGFEFSYDKTNKAGEVVDSTTVRYKMLMRSPGKAKNGECIFIRDSLYDTAIKYLTMGLFGEMQKKATKNPDAVFNIVGLSAYQTLTTATAYGYIQIPLDNILILKDIEVESEPMAAAIVSAKEKPPEKKDDEETGEQGKGTKNKGTQEQEEKKEEPKKYICSVEHTKARIKNVLWDGMGLIDDAEFPVGMDGFIYCRSHFFKSCLFRGQLQRFFKDYCKEHGLDYSTYTVKDMFGNERRLCDIKVIVTDKSLKWLKFIELMGGTKEKAYKKYAKIMKNNDYYFSIVKTAHSSRWGDKQLTTYQMNNSLPCTDTEVLERIVQPSVDFYYSLKNDKKYLEYLKAKSSNFNINELLIELVKRDYRFVYSNLYKKKKDRDCTDLKSELRQGRLYQSGDNLTIMDNPVALLRYAVGDPEPLKEGCFSIVEDGVQCYTTRFKDGASLAAFRSPHNAPNNIIHLWNTYSKPLQKYFPNIGDNVIVFNAIGTDTQPRLSGHDVDSDFVLVTDQPDIAALSAKAYKEYPTIINAVEEVTGTGDSKTAYHLKMEDYARMDNKISAAQASIGISTDIAQLALSYYFENGTKDENKSKELKDNIIILSVLGQISIDLAKKEFIINVKNEIQRIKWLDCMRRDKNKTDNKNTNNSIEKNNEGNNAKKNNADENKPDENKPDKEKVIKYPIFYAETKKERNNKKFKQEEVGFINCPMDIMAKLIDEKTKSYKPRTNVIPIYRLTTDEVKNATPKNRYRADKFIECAKQYTADIKNLNNNIEDKDSKNYSRQRQYLEDKFMNDATKGLDQEQIYYLVKLSLGREYSAIRNIMLLFLYRRYKDELLNCFIKK